MLYTPVCLQDEAKCMKIEYTGVFSNKLNLNG